MGKRKSKADTNEGGKRRECNVWNDVHRGNDQYINYYKLQNILSSDDEEEFLQIMVFAKLRV